MAVRCLICSGTLSLLQVSRQSAFTKIWHPAAVRFQARMSNELWQFDMSPSDLKQVKQPLWVEPGRGNPTLMLFSTVDDRSGVVYQEYRCVYGEDAESALRFFFNAMAAKPENDMPFQGIPEAIYMDNGPVARSRVFQNVMACLGVRIMTHIPAGKDGKRVTARSKGKVDGLYRVEHDQSKNLLTYHDLLQQFIEHDQEIEFRQTEIAAIKFPLKLVEVTQVDSKVSPAVQLADVMIGSAIEAANSLAGLRSGGLDPEAVLSLYADDQFIHLIPSIDFEEQRRFRQGTQAADVIDYFSTNFFMPRRS